MSFFIRVLKQEVSSITNLKSIGLKQRTIYQLIIIILVSTLGIAGLSSCNSSNCDQKNRYADVPIQLNVERLENEIIDLKNTEQVLAFFQQNRVMANYFLDALQYPNDTILAKRLFRLMKQPSIDTLIDDTKVYFSDFDQNIDQLTTAYQFIKYHYPTSRVPKIQTIITGFYNDMYISDSLIVLGLDYFAGEHGRYYPNDIPRYIVKRYMKESLAPITLSFVSNEFNLADQSHGTLLADMVNLGKSYYFVEQALPCTPDSLIIGYTSEEMHAVQTNQEIIWANIIENEMLYETSHFLKNKFIGERPNVVEISKNCPGRVGAWLGWQIVRKYMNEHPEVSFTDLMADTDAHKIFQQSNYKPRNKSQ
ncbi:gliding motility lipoprotein GldB [Reichenbachiella carrageenanivorans]|uniref:Gliding motility lipoprotein GldB n=1 Tax=Reichenbachiella carrageenanivorans TaxID=2979869 RepID=A0ABY6D294_9BACT|nr:gliding motility lipoprotein GldB [Reichenbachiella carrageenanivorans]UXX80282.1 gliding motility lipoprotein GldB [Reichenbachiella carrageenanivorans]